MNTLPPEIVETLKMFLEEDVRSGDLTTNVTIPEDKTALATIYAREKAILAGIKEAEAIAYLTGLTYEVLVFEGNWVNPEEPVMRLRGKARTLLTVERLILNIIQRMSGIATKTYRMVSVAREVNPKVKIACTRKTTQDSDSLKNELLSLVVEILIVMHSMIWSSSRTITSLQLEGFKKPSVQPRMQYHSVRKYLVKHVPFRKLKKQSAQEQISYSLIISHHRILVVS